MKNDNVSNFFKSKVINLMLRLHVDRFGLEKVANIVVLHYSEKHVKRKIMLDSVDDCLVPVQTHFC
jgi:hypothetical protein